MNDTGTQRNLSELCAELTDRLNATQFGKSERRELNQVHQALGKVLDIAETHRRRAEAHRRKAMSRLMRYLGIGTVAVGFLLLVLVHNLVVCIFAKYDFGAVVLSVIVLCFAGALFAAVRVLHQLIDQQ